MITPRSENFPQWFQDIVREAELAEHGATKGTMIMRPTSWGIWERLQREIDGLFAEHDVENVAFPQFIPMSYFEREADHVEGFAPELAVVTHAGGEELSEPIAVRPTSETVIYEAFSRWIQSYRDLPLKINQWNSVVRWEKRTRLFLRTSEFWWQEGHSAHATAEDADAHATAMLEAYTRFAQEILCIDVIPGEKTPAERFPGARRTQTIEAIMQDGKALQSGTSHSLTSGFAQAFDVAYLDEQNQSQVCHPTSWGLSTRMLGALIMTHADDRGLVLPPRIAPYQAVIVVMDPSCEADASSLRARLSEAGIRTKIDKRDIQPGQRLAEWERKGIPLRMEFGKRDQAKQSVFMADRLSGKKQAVSWEALIETARYSLEDIHSQLRAQGRALHERLIISVDTWEEAKLHLEQGRAVMAHYDGTSETEVALKDEASATIRCIPHAEPITRGHCLYSGASVEAKRVLIAKAY